MSNPNPRTFTKQQLADSLGVTYRSMFKYHDLCFGFISDFRNDYPTIDGQPYTRDNITLYQFWAVTQVFKDFVNRPVKVVRHFLSDPNWATRYSKQAFLNSQLKNESVADGQLVTI